VIGMGEALYYERAHTPNKSALPLGRAGWNCAIGVKGQSERRAAAPLCNGTGAASSEHEARRALSNDRAFIMMVTEHSL
jgi:hypothetical protein